MGLIKEWFDLWVQINWHKVIKKEFRKYERLQDAAEHQHRVVKKLCEAYWEKYPPKKEG